MKKKSWKTVFAEDTALITMPETLPASKSDDAFAKATKTGDWLPRLQLMTANSDKVKSGEFPMNHYALINGQTLRDVGLTVDVLVIAWRPKAIEMGDEIISVFDVNLPEFVRIQEKSEVKDSGCMYGPEFLLWVPQCKEFATFFMGSKSARREAPGVKARMLKGGTLKSQNVKTAKYSWQVPLCVPCSTPFELPAEEGVAVEAEKFLNPPKSTVEKATEAEKQGADRAR
jgi:hypothetical protein